MEKKIPQAITLEPIALEHIEAMQEFASDPKISVPVNFEYPYPRNAAENYIKNHIEEHKKKYSFTFAVTQNLMFIGICNLHSLCYEQKIAEMAFWIAKPYWGLGYAKQSVKALLRFAFTQIDLEAVTACTFNYNKRAIRFLEKMGFQAKGETLRYSNKLHRSISACLFGFTQAAWLEKFTSPTPCQQTDKTIEPSSD